ncbi:hypothetical protein YC2023_019978 [Brassica napus]
MRNGFKFGVLMFKKIRERLESFTVRNITFLLQPFERKKENVNSRRSEFFVPVADQNIWCKENVRSSKPLKSFAQCSMEGGLGSNTILVQMHSEGTLLQNTQIEILKISAVDSTSKSNGQNFKKTHHKKQLIFFFLHHNQISHSHSPQEVTI